MKNGIENEQDIILFMDWMYRYNDKEINMYFKPLIMNNLIQSYEFLGGDMYMNRTRASKQIIIMWSYVKNWYDNERIKRIS